MITLKVVNLKQLQKRFNDSPRKLNRALGVAVDKAGVQAVKSTQSVISSGRNMWKPPVDTGAMRAGIYKRTAGLTSTIKPSKSTFYAGWVHDGTKSASGGIKMKKRPFFEITEKTEAETIQEAFKKELDINKII